MGLSPKQKIFVQCFAGNATAAAREAGYKNPEVIGCENLKKLNIIEALEERNREETESRILTRQQRQVFWSDITTGKIGEKGLDNDGNEVATPAALRERIKASELLGKSQADFIERKLVTAEVGVSGTVNMPEIQELIKKYVSTD